MTLMLKVSEIIALRRLRSSLKDDAIGKPERDALDAVIEAFGPYEHLRITTDDKPIAFEVDTAIERVRDKLDPDELLMLAEILRRRLEPDRGRTRGLLGNDARAVVEKTLSILDAPATPEAIAWKANDRVVRCPRCHRPGPNPAGCANCNPEELGRRLLAANAEIERLRKQKRWYVLVRVKVTANLRRCFSDGAARMSTPLIRAYHPLWWKIDDHDGSGDAVADGAYTIAIASLDAESHEDACAKFRASAVFYRPLLEDLPDAPEDWPASMDSEQFDEHMAGFFMERIKARRADQPEPEAPSVSRKLAVGDVANILIMLNGCRVIDTSSGHGRCYAIQPTTDKYIPRARPVFWIDAHEVVRAATVGKFVCGALFDVILDHGGFDLRHHETCGLHLGHDGPHARTP